MTKKLTSEDKTLWRFITRHMMPLSMHSTEAVTDDDFELLLKSAAKPITSRPLPKPQAAKTILQKPAAPSNDVDLRTLNKFKRGQMPIDATLDLHGHGLVEARFALLAFIKKVHAHHGRCILLIHGKGSITGEAKIKRTFPDWLSEIPDIVLTYTPAKAQHGGAGASYILLRRKRVT